MGYGLSHEISINISSGFFMYLVHLVRSSYLWFKPTEPTQLLTGPDRETGSLSSLGQGEASSQQDYHAPG